MLLLTVVGVFIKKLCSDSVHISFEFWLTIYKLLFSRTSNYFHMEKILLLNYSHEDFKHAYPLLLIVFKRISMDWRY